MVDKFFLALDYPSEEEALEKGIASLEVLESKFGRDFVEERVGVKVNQDLLTAGIDPDLRTFTDEWGCPVFADLKLGHGYDTGERIIGRIISPTHGNLPIKYFTVSAGLGSTILSKYVAFARKLGMDVIAFTAHTKIPPQEVSRMYAGRDLDDVVYNLGQVASDAGCHAIVLEGERLRNERIRGLPLKKLVTGIRIDPSDKGTQSRVTSLEDLEQVKEYVDYVVVSSRYVSNPESLRGYFAALL